MVLTRYSPRTVLSRNVLQPLQDVADMLHTRIFDTRIRECIAIREAQVERKTIYEYAPKSNAVADYNSLLDELEGVLS
jgi:chromosome partitioning protein